MLGCTREQDTRREQSRLSHKNVPTEDMKGGKGIKKNHKNTRKKIIGPKIRGSG